MWIVAMYVYAVTEKTVDPLQDQRQHRQILLCYSVAVKTHLNFSKGQFNQPVVIQKYVSWGAT